MASYLPLADGPLRDWAKNFSDQISAGGDPTALGLTLDQTMAYASLSGDYATKLAASINPETRGGATVLAKNNAKKALVAESRRLAMIVTNHPGVTDEQRYDMGLTIRDTTPTPVPPPSESPTIDVLSVEGWTLNIRLHDDSATSRGKPEGVTGALVFTYVGDVAPVDVDAWKFEGTASRTTTKVIFPSTLAPGTKVWLTAAWVNRKLQTGPAAMPVSRLISGDGLSKKAA